ncbi:MAG: YvcK family protein [Candidatus Omnitrophica bacterium]|nr:YvcK family protein [Candidatus Omnitrophota bacterium]
MRLLKWLYPGMQVKRWLLLAVAGILLFGMGASLLAIDEASFAVRALSLVFLGSGLYALVTGWRGSVHSLLDVILPGHGRDLVELIYQRRHLQKGPRIVAIGGGTGLSTLLHGLKPYTTNLTAIVTMADDGGSSGRLREEFGMVPPGDIRNCLVALADAEPLMQRLFQYRFTGSSALQGHNFGNLFITAMTQITGDFQQAIRASSKVLAIRGHVVPSTCEKVRLAAEHEDGSITVGESRISQAPQPIRRVYLEPANPAPTQEALEAVRHADVIVLGPGSLYTSIIPNLLADGMVEALLQSKALKIYVCNVMTQFRETAGFKASDHVRALVAHASPGIIHVCIVNTKPVPPELLERYRTEQAFPVEPDADTIRRLGCQVVTGEVISTADYVRHDADRLARLIVQLAVGRRPLSGSWPSGAPAGSSQPAAEPPSPAGVSAAAGV